MLVFVEDQVELNSALSKLSDLQVHKGNLTTLKNNQQETKLEIRQQKAIAMSTPKGYSKTQSYIIPEKDDMIPEKNDIYEDKEEYRKAELDNMEDEKSKVQNGAQTIPPKPLPRASRTNSLSEEGNNKEEPKPVARPRTTPNPGSVVTSVNPNVIGGYKV
jgi:hypothetical protein